MMLPLIQRHHRKFIMFSCESILVNRKQLNSINSSHFYRYPGPSYYGGPYTAYSNPYADEISPYASYHDPTLHSAIPSYAFDHDHYPHHFDHHATDYGHYLPDHMHTPGGMMNDETDSKDSDVGVAASPSGSGSSGNSNGAGIAAMSPTYRRVGRHRRRRENKRQQFE